MTEHKFTDEEVIRALRCLSGEEIFCKDCYFGSLADHGFACKKNVSKAVLDLINRQKAEIANLINAVDNSTKEFLKLHDAYQDQKAELDDFREIVFTDRTEAIKKLKAEAIKEFSEKLKDFGEVATSLADGENIVAVDVSFIDKLVEEMTGGDENG